MSEKLDNDVAEQLNSYIDSKVDRTVVDKTTHLALKEDLANAKTDMIKWFVGLFMALASMIIGFILKVNLYHHYCLFTEVRLMNKNPQSIYIWIGDFALLHYPPCCAGATDSNCALGLN